MLGALALALPSMASGGAALQELADLAESLAASPPPVAAFRGPGADSPPLPAGIPGVGRWASVKGMRLFYREAGQGRPVVLLHGLGGTSFDFRRVLEPLDHAGFRAIAIDLKGAGDSDKPRDGRYGVSDMAELLEDFMTTLGLGPVSIVANSYGGSIALVHVQRHPERVERLALINPAAYTDGVTEGRWMYTMPLLPDAVFALLSSRWLAEFGLKRNYHRDELIRPEEVDEYARVAGLPGVRRAFLDMQRQYLSPEIPRWIEGYRRIRRPVLLLWGLHDELLPLGHGPRLAQDLPNAQAVFLKECGHVCHQERPELVNPRLIRFLSGR